MRDGARLRRVAGSVRFRITALATVVVLLVLAVAAVVLVAVQERLLTDAVDDAVRQRADDLTALVVAGQIPDTIANRGDEDTLAQLLSTDGEILAASPNIAGEPPIAVMPAPTFSDQLRTVEGLPVDDDSFRLLSRRITADRGEFVLHVAGTLDDVSDSLAALATSLTAAIPLVTAVLAALVWTLVGRALRPVDAICAEVAAISGPDLHRRVPEPARDDEIARLARTMNDMLDRVEDANDRQRRFTADASHELRSPLTRIRSELEVDLAHPDRADPSATQVSVLEEVIGLQHLVDDLLYLARSDAGVPSARREPVDLDDLVLREGRRLREAGRVVVDLSGVSAAQVSGDADELARAVRNLADNASHHAAGRVSLTLAETKGQAVLTVADDGPGVPPDQAEAVFDRFTRLDDARNAGTGGTGLGLAIARDIVERHDGTIAIDMHHRPGACFVVTLPTTDGG